MNPLVALTTFFAMMWSGVTGYNIATGETFLMVISIMVSLFFYVATLFASEEV